MAKYGKKAQEEVKNEMDRLKKGTAHSGKKHKKVKSRKQAIAIALSKARKKGAKAPAKPKTSKSTKRTASKTTKRRTTKRTSKK